MRSSGATGQSTDTFSLITAGLPELWTDEGAFGPRSWLAACRKVRVSSRRAYPGVLLWMMSLCGAVRVECVLCGVSGAAF